jgi:hypothetical protein
MKNEANSRNGPGARRLRNGWRCGHALCWAVRKDWKAAKLPGNCALLIRPYANGAAALASPAWKAWPTNPRPGAPRKITDAQVEALITRTLEGTPDQATHWSTRSMAHVIGLSQSGISRIWRAFSLQPHRVETFKLSSDPFFIEKVRDIVGLYLNPPDHALVLCVDEKSQIQSLDRTRPILPLRPGVPARQSHDYVRNGTTSLFAALDVASGKVIGSLHHRQRHQEFLRFLEKIDAAIPESLEIHLVMDNYGTHKMPKVKRWFARRPRYHLHFTPTSASWLKSG